MTTLRSRDNPRVRRWAALGEDRRLRRRERRALIEGPHLLHALLEQRRRPEALMVSESGLRRPDIAALVAAAGVAPVILTDELFRATVDVEAPQGIAAEISTVQDAVLPRGDCAFLEGIQDAGNVGAIIRSAAALGVASVVLDPACADPWSPKALRAGMGGHFAIRVHDSVDLAHEASQFDGRLLCTVSRGGEALRGADLAGRLGWIFGNEGQGVSEALAAAAQTRITIPLAAGADSLNVAAAAAVCFYEALRRRETLNTSGAGS